LRDAVERLRSVRVRQRNAGGLVIAGDQEHARGIADLLSWRLHVTASVVTSDDPTASDRIAAFAASDAEWLVAVRMVSEGVDIPRLRVGVYATPTTTDLFFRQAVGRLVRWTAGERDQRAWLYMPDDPRLRTWAAQIASQRRHSLLRTTSEVPEHELVSERDPLEQLSMFAPLSAVATHVAPLSPWDEALPAAWFSDAQQVELELPPIPGTGSEVGSTRREAKDALRNANANAARDIARRTGQSHAFVNAELNRLAGVRRITEATVAQLEARFHHAERWLARL
jgi:superfamily II DNA or RNA helicase